MNVMIILFFSLLREVKCHLEGAKVELEGENNSTNDQFKPDEISTDVSETSLLSYLKTNHVRGIALVAYVGAAITIPCTRASTHHQMPIWLYSKSISNLTFRAMEGRNVVKDYMSLRIYYVREADAGVYQCRVGSFLGDLVVLNVLDVEDKYDLVKPNSTLGPYPSPPTPITEELMLFSSWSDWSECSRCGGVGRRRRYGPCYLGYGRSNETTSVVEDDNTTSIQETTFSLNNTEELLRVFPDGIPCRSRLLSKTIKGLPAVALRKNEIMIGLCKVPCTSDIFELRSDNGEILELANNSDGVYSLYQGEPQQPPPVSRVIVFVAVGSSFIVKCPGTTLWDSPMNWRLGGDEVAPRVLDSMSNGRVYLNARDHVVIADVRITDSNVYSCWQRQNLAGVVKLKVFEDLCHKYGRRLILLALIMCLTLVFRLMEDLYSYQRRRYLLS